MNNYYPVLGYVIVWIGLAQLGWDLSVHKGGSMPMRHMGSLDRTTEEGMEPLILPEVGSGVVINGAIGGVMGHRRHL